MQQQMLKIKTVPSSKSIYQKGECPMSTQNNIYINKEEFNMNPIDLETINTIYLLSKELVETPLCKYNRWREKVEFVTRNWSDEKLSLLYDLCLDKIEHSLAKAVASMKADRLKDLPQHLVCKIDFYRCLVLSDSLVPDRIPLEPVKCEYELEQTIKKSLCDAVCDAIETKSSKQFVKDCSYIYNQTLHSKDLNEQAFCLGMVIEGITPQLAKAADKLDFDNRFVEDLKELYRFFNDSDFENHPRVYFKHLYFHEEQLEFYIENMAAFEKDMAEDGADLKGEE